jgi:hypothetical protein
VDRPAAPRRRCLSTWWDQEVLPSSALPVLGFLQHAVRPNTLTFGLGEDALNTGRIPLSEGIGVAVEQVHFVEQLDRVQAAAGEAFPIPRNRTISDLYKVARATRMLNGERVSMGRGAVTFQTDDPQLAADLTSETATTQITAAAGFVVEVAGHHLNLGPFTLIVPNPTVEVTEVGEGTAESLFNISLRPGPDETHFAVLGEVHSDVDTDLP